MNNGDDRPEFWVTVSVKARDQSDAEQFAEKLTVNYPVDVVDVQQAPPQGATIVGDYNY